MPLLSDAKKLFVGGTSINKVFSNGFVVWPKVTLNPCVTTPTDCYAAGDIVVKTAQRDASYYVPYPRKDAYWLLEVFFWAPKCIDDPDNGYCSPYYRFVGEEFDPCPGYRPGENWWGTEQLLSYVKVIDDESGGNSVNRPVQPHNPIIASFGTNIKVERYGTQENIFMNMPFWWYRLYAYECNANAVPPCEYSDAIAMCTRESGDRTTGIQKFQIQLKYKVDSLNLYKKTNFKYSDGSAWGTGNDSPSYGFDKNP